MDIYVDRLNNNNPNKKEEKKGFVEGETITLKGIE